MHDLLFWSKHLDRERKGERIEVLELHFKKWNNGFKIKSNNQKEKRKKITGLENQYFFILYNYFMVSYNK